MSKECVEKIDLWLEMKFKSEFDTSMSLSLINSRKTRNIIHHNMPSCNNQNIPQICRPVQSVGSGETDSETFHLHF